jgi:signal transduction histidine kinase
MRVTLAGLLVVPLVSLVALWAFAASITLGNALHEHNYNRLVALTAAPTDDLANQVSQERQQTFTWLSTDPRPPAAQLAATRDRTSAAVAAYRRLVQQTRGLRPASGEAAQATLMTLLSRLPTIRASVDSEVLSPAAAFAAYSNIMSAIFAVYSASEQVNNDLSVDKQTDASLDAAQALEFASQEATLVGGAAAARGQMTTGDRHLFANAVTSQRLLIASALGEFDAQLRAPWQRAYTSPAHHRLASLENRISGSIGSRAPIPVNVRTWQAASRAFLAEMQQAQLQDAPPLAAMASRLSDRLVLEAALAGGVGLVAVLLSVFVLLRYGRRLNGELTTLHDTAQSMADQRLPAVVERLRKGEHVDVDAESPPPPPGTITEIARVAQAFTTVQHTAVEAAVGQASLRRGVNRVFLNLSLRNQSLLHRQLGMLDAMERATSEPAALGDLFRLDHLTTRMRRHAESLIILSGATPGRGWRDPVPVIDVLRAAIAEVEDYVRVDVASDSQDAVVGTAVNDVIHLVAELVENATTFSPPTTRVEIRADSVGNGFAVEIEDRGLGLPAGELAEINQRLASPPEFDLASSDQLGLFVVGQLAGRHGITVSLRDSPYGGTTAIVLMPHSLIVPAGETAQPASTTGPASMAWAASTAGPASAAGPPAPANGNTFPAGYDRAGTREQGATFSLTGRHQPGTKAPETAADPEPGPWTLAQLRPQAPGQAAAPSLPSREPAPPAAPGGSPGRTYRGLPRRVRQASLAPQLREQARAQPPAGPAAAGPADLPLRSPEENRDLMSSLQQGWLLGRVDDLDDPDDGLKDWPGGHPGAAADSSDSEAPG